VALNPDDPAAKEHLTAVVAEWESGVARLKGAIENAQTNEEILASASNIFSLFYLLKTDLLKMLKWSLILLLLLIDSMNL